MSDDLSDAAHSVPHSPPDSAPSFSKRLALNVSVAGAGAVPVFGNSADDLPVHTIFLQHADAPEDEALDMSTNTSEAAVLTEASKSNSSTNAAEAATLPLSFKPHNRRLTFRYLNSANLYTNKIFHNAHTVNELKDIVVKHSDNDNGSVETLKLPTILQDAGVEMDADVEDNVSKLAVKLHKAHGTDLSMMQVVGYVQRIRKLCLEKAKMVKDRSRLKRLVFLGGSCNPTSWRQDSLIPYLEKQDYTYFNPQVEDWTPECVFEEAIAKQEATVLFFVIDNQTRALASMIEVVENICSGRIFVLVVKDVNLGATITGKIVDTNEARDLNLARAYLADIASRHGLLVFNDIKFAAKYTCEYVIPHIKKQQCSEAAIKHRHSTAFSTRAAYSNLITLQDKKQYSESVFYTNRLVSCSCPFTVHDVLQRALEDSPDNKITVEVVHTCLAQLGVTLTQQQEQAVMAQVSQKLDHHEIILFMEEIFREHLRMAREDQSKHDEHYDVFLGGSCSKYSTWRAEIAIPILSKMGVRYFDPLRIDWKPNHAFDELRAKFGALIVMFVVDCKCRGLATMIDAVEMIIGQKQRIVIVVEDVDPSANPTIDPKECKDLNRARAYLADVASRHGLLVYNNVRHATEYAAEKVYLLRKFSGEKERWNTLCAHENEPTIEVVETDLHGKRKDSANESKTDTASAAKTTSTTPAAAATGAADTSPKAPATAATATTNTKSESSRSKACIIT